MDFGKWDTLFHLVLFLLWMSAWSANHRDAVFNTYLARIDWLTSAFTGGLRRILPLAPPWALIAVLFGAVLLTRSALATQGVPVLINHGFVTTAVSTDGHFTASMARTSASFASFLFKVWSIGMLYLGFRQTRRVSPSRVALHHACQPLSLLEPAWRPLGLLIFGMGLTYAIHAMGTETVNIGSATFLKIGLSTLAAFAGVLAILSSILMVLIIGSWVGLLTGSSEIHWICSDWIDLFLGPFRRFPLRLGFLDLTPLLVFFTLGWVHRGLITVLSHAYNVTLSQG